MFIMETFCQKEMFELKKVTGDKINNNVIPLFGRQALNSEWRPSIRDDAWIIALHSFLRGPGQNGVIGSQLLVIKQ